MSDSWSELDGSTKHRTTCSALSIVRSRLNNSNTKGLSAIAIVYRLKVVDEIPKIHKAV